MAESPGAMQLRTLQTIDGVVAHWGALHVLVNCAGWDKPMPFVETTPEFWDKILAVNLRGPLACTRAAPCRSDSAMVARRSCRPMPWPRWSALT